MKTQEHISAGMKYQMRYDKHYSYPKTKECKEEKVSFTDRLLYALFWLAIGATLFYFIFKN